MTGNSNSPVIAVIYLEHVIFRKKFFKYDDVQGRRERAAHNNLSEKLND